MIKKILGLLVVVFSCIGFSYGFDLSTNMYVRQNGDYGFSPYDMQYNINVVNKGNLLTERIGQTVKGVYLFDGTYMIWKYSDYLGGIFPFLSYHLTGNVNAYYQGFPTHYALCDEFDGDNHIEDYNLTGCIVSILERDSLGLITNFMSSITIDDTFGFNYKKVIFVNSPENNNAGVLFCFSSSSYHKSLCFGITRRIYGSDYIYPGFAPSSYGYSGYGVSMPYTFSSLFSSDINYSPGSNNNIDVGTGESFGSGNTETIPSDVENYIEYFEDLYGRNESMCYVGVGDSYLDVSYGSGGISFSEGRGATIFGLYYHLYNTFGNDIVYNVGSFINAWTNNLYNTYKSDPYYIQYNGPGDNTTVIYSGSFPFLNQPVAIYFMADNLNSYDNTENNGQGVAVYCNIKLNKEGYENGSLDFNDFEELIPDYMKNNVKNYTNTSVGGKDGYSTPYLGSGSIWGNLVQTGYNIPKDLNPTDLFSDFFDKINGLIRNFNPAVRDGLIPLWIIYPMLFLILFRIMRH